MKKIIQIKIALTLLVMFVGGLVQAQNTPQVFNSIDEVFAQKHRPLPDQTRTVDYTVTNTRISSRQLCNYGNRRFASRYKYVCLSKPGK